MNVVFARTAFAILVLGAWPGAAQALGQRPATAQEGRWLQRTVSVDLGHASLAEALQDLATRAGITIAADGTPFVAAADVRASGPLHQVLDTVAGAFDCAWSSPRPNVVVVSKKFSSRMDRPQLIPAEIAQMARDMRAVLPDGVAGDNLTCEEELAVLGGSLTQEQAGALGGGKWLRMADLTPSQREMVRHAVDTRLFAALRGHLDALAFRMEHLDAARLEEVAAPRPVEPLPPGQKVVIRPAPPLNPGDRAVLRLNQPGPDGHPLVRTFADFPVGGPFLLAEPGPGAPTGQRPEAPDMSARSRAPAGDALGARVKAAVARGTVADLMRALSGVCDARIEPARYARDRLVTVFAPDSTVRSVVDAVADLCGWVAARQANGTYLVGRRQPVRPKNPSGLPAALREAIQPDMRAFAHLPDLKTTTPPERPPFFDAYSKGSQAAMRLTSSVAPRLDQARALTYADLGAQERGDLLLYLAVVPFQRLDQIAAPSSPLLHTSPSALMLAFGGGSLMLYTGPLGTPGIWSFGADVDHAAEVRQLIAAGRMLPEPRPER